MLVDVGFLQGLYLSKAIPGVVATFAPPGEPILPCCQLLMRTHIFVFARKSGLITFLKSTVGHIAFLSSHR